jgi:hypothetical protein
MSLFPFIEQTLADLRQDRLGAPLLSGLCLSDSYLETQIRAAEADAALALRVFLTPTLVLPETATEAEKDALDEAGTPWVEEPGYDLEGDFFAGERWGYLVTRHRPIISVQSMQFVYPQPYSGVFTVPSDWIRTDKKYGHIRLVPGTQAFAAPMSAWVMQVMGAGRTIPQMIQLRYTAGLRNAAVQHPELPDLVLRMAMLRVLNNQFPATSGSISADGLSESQSIQLNQYQGDIDASLERLRQVIHGVQCLVC